MQVEKEGLLLSEYINNQFDIARSKTNELNEDFAQQVETNNNSLLETYDQLQKNVVNLKVDMMQAFNISVDFVDADGD